MSKAKIKVKLTDAERRGLEVMARAAKWVDSGALTAVRANWHRVHGATARRLEKRGLAKSQLQFPDGSPALTGLQSSYCQTRYTITRAGMKAIGWQGMVL